MDALGTAPPVVEDFPARFRRHRLLARTYALRGGFEAIYDDMPQPIGMMKFAPLQPARGGIFSARQRLAREGSESSPAPAPEADLYRE